MLLPKDFKEFIALMICGNLGFTTTGRLAYNLYRNPRTTGDIDFIVSHDSTNQEKLRRVLVSFGFGSTLPEAGQSIIELGKVIMLGRAPFRIDLLTEIDGVNFPEIEKTCRTFFIDGLEIPVISPEHLLKNKQAAGRPKDLADAESLRQWLFPDDENGPA